MSVGGNLYRIDNVPFFVFGVSCDDVVVAELDQLLSLHYVSLEEESGHSTIRVVLYEGTPDGTPLSERMQLLREQMKAIGCPSEQSHIPGLVAIDVPPNVNYELVRDILDRGLKQELWSYEEATLAHS